MIFHHFYLTFYTLQYIISQRRPPTCCGPHSPPHIQTHRPYDSASSTLNLMSDIRFHWRKFTTTLPCLSLYLTLVHTGHSRLTQAKQTHTKYQVQSHERDRILSHPPHLVLLHIWILYSFALYITLLLLLLSSPSFSLIVISSSW